jgi:hypothetical protein
MSVNNLRGQKPSKTYNELLRVVSGSVYDSTGSLVTFLNITASAASTIAGSSSTTFPWLITNNRLYTSQSFNVEVTGSLTVFGNSNDVFIIKSQGATQNLFKVSSSGVVEMYVNNTDPTSNAELGQMYFTSQSLFLGLQ